MSKLQFFYTGLWAISLIASGLIVRSRCPGAKASGWYCAGSILAAAIILVRLALIFNLDNPMALKGLGMIRYGSIFSYVMMAVVFLPGMGMSKGHALLKAGILCLVAEAVFYAFVAPRGIRFPYQAYIVINFLPYVLLFAGSFARGTVAAHKPADATTADAKASNGTFDGNDTGMPLPPGAAAFAQKMAGIEPAGDERGSVAVGVLLCLLSIVLFIGIGLLPLFLSIYDETILYGSLGLGFIAFIALLVIGLKIAQSGSLAALVGPVRETIEPQLSRGETILALNSGKRMGLAFWLHGMTPTGIVVFTNRRIFLLAFESAFRSPVKALKKKQGVTVLACDGMDKDQVRWGGMLTPPGMHMYATKLTLKPDGKDKAISYAVFRFGKNWKTIRQIRDRMK